MSEYLVNDTDLTSVANAIRTKGGTSSPLAFPNGFVSAVNAIPSGGGGGITATLPNRYTLRVYYDITDNYYYDGVTISIYRGANAFAKTTLIKGEDYCLGENYFDVSVAAASAGSWITVTYTNQKNYGGYTPKIVLSHIGNEEQLTFSSWADMNDNFRVLRTQYKLNSNLNEITFQIENDNAGYAMFLAAEYED